MQRTFSKFALTVLALMILSLTSLSAQRASAQAPDLVITTANTAQSPVNGRWYLRALVRNVGTMGAAPSQMRLTMIPAIPTPQIFAPIPALPSGASVWVSFLLPPVRPPAGTVASLQADCFLAVPESNELNNGFAFIF